MSPSRGKVNEVGLKILMKEGGIPGVSIAFFDSTGTVESRVLGIDHKSKTELTKESVFRAASLTKPVFAYLVLKLIEDNKSGKAKHGLGKFNLPDGKVFDLDTPLCEVYPEMLNRFSGSDVAKASKITARHILSHQTGLPLNQRNEGLTFQFEPGTEYGYSNPGILLLQEVIDKLTGSNIQTLAQENVFGPNALDMQHSSFVPPAHFANDVKLGQMNAANSLHTTASDYAKFVTALLHDDKLRELAFTFTEQNISMEHDKWAIEQGISSQDLKQVTWGLGWGLQVNASGKKAFHSGDMNEWRAFIAIDVDKKKGVVFFTNSPNGLLLADTIVQPAVDLEHGLKYVFQKYGFARKVEPYWQKKEIDRIIKIITKHELGIPDLVKKGLIVIEDNKGLSTLSLKCDPNYSLFNKTIMNELDDFKSKNGMKYDRDCYVKTKTDKHGNILSLSINIPKPDLYNKFIDHLNAEKLLPQENAPQQAAASAYQSPQLKPPGSTR